MDISCIDLGYIDIMMYEYTDIWIYGYIPIWLYRYTDIRKCELWIYV